VFTLEPRKVAGYVIVATLLGILVVQYVRALPASVQDDRTASCRALNPMPFNPKLGKLPAKAPDFKAQDHTGQMASLAAYRGKVVFLNFWQTACPPCKDEMPAMEALERHIGREDFVVLALSSDPTWEPVRSFFPHGTEMTVLLDPPVSGVAQLAQPVLEQPLRGDGPRAQRGCHSVGLPVTHWRRCSRPRCRMTRTLPAEMPSSDATSLAPQSSKNVRTSTDRSRSGSPRRQSRTRA